MLHGEAVGRYFMGTRMQCAHCHNHPLDRWTMDDYFGLAAIFAKLDRGPIVKTLERSYLYHPQTQDVIAPKLLGESSVLHEKEARAATLPYGTLRRADSQKSMSIDYGRRYLVMDWSNRWMIGHKPIHRFSLNC
ncbi:MAG: DUF1549 domain-containing protein [Pirellulales bacterium]